MRTAETATALAEFADRGAGSNAERRAANHLCDELAQGRRTASVETFWCRPNWPLAQAWHVALGIAGSLVSVSQARVGAALLLVAIVCVIADWQVGDSPGRRLTPERASQNVVSHVPGQTRGRRVRLVLTANYDGPRLGFAHRLHATAAFRRARAATHGLPPGWVAWLVLALAWLLATAIARLQGDQHSSLVGILQLPPTIALVLAGALLVELSTAGHGPSARDNATGVAAAIALGRALDAAPPALAAVEVVLTGAGDSTGIGLRRYLRARRHSHTAHNTVVVGLAPCGAGALRHWHSDGPLVPSAYFAALRRLCAELASDEPELSPVPHRGRGCSPALPARMAQIPAITLGRPEADGGDGGELDPAALDATVQTGLLLVDALDSYLHDLPSPTPA